MNHRVLPEADGEGIAAALWYDERKSGLGDDFLDEMQAAFVRVRGNPRGQTRLEYDSGLHEIRRVLLKRFPYFVIFACRPDEILVVAVAHTRRRPLYWLDRLT